MSLAELVLKSVELGQLHPDLGLLLLLGKVIGRLLLDGPSSLLATMQMKENLGY